MRTTTRPGALQRKTHQDQITGETAKSRGSRRSLRRVGLASTLAIGSLFFAACSSDDSTSTDAQAAVSDAVSDVSDAADDAAGAVSEAADSIVADSVNGDEGLAKNLAVQIVATLSASTTGGEPVMASIDEAVKVVTEPNKVTGLEDADNDGKDDDAKFTVETNSGDDKACVQSQNGVWEVTDDEC